MTDIRPFSATAGFSVRRQFARFLEELFGIDCGGRPLRPLPHPHADGDPRRPSYLQRDSVPRSLNDLEAHRCSVFRHSEDGRIIPWRVKVGDGEQDHPVRPASCTNDE